MTEIIGKATLHNVDCMELLKNTPDKFYDLALVDPPYGIERLKNPSGRLERFGDTRKANNNVPTKEYFNELLRVSKNQVIWGANHFWENNLGNCTGFIFWDKEMTVDNYSDGEMAWTSFGKTSKIFKFAWNGMLQGDMKNKEQRIHPTQKPVKLYEWLLTNYAKKGDKILDTHLGSMSSVIACLNLGFEITGCELDKDYFESGIKRVEQSQKQQRMFE